MNGIKVESKTRMLEGVPAASLEYSQIDKKTNCLYIPQNLIEKMSISNLYFDEEYDCFVNPNFGAWMSNCDSDIGTVEKLLTHFPEKYEEVVQNGYEIAIGIGMPAPLMYNFHPKHLILPGKGNGVYLKNYRELMNIQKNNEKEGIIIK